MCRYRVSEPEIPSGIAIKNKRRKRARDQNLNVCLLSLLHVQAQVDLSQEPLRDSYQTHVIAARQGAQQAIQGITFKTRLNEMQVVARHAYAMTFEKEFVEQWEEQLSRGMWGGKGPETHELLEQDRVDAQEALRPR